MLATILFCLALAAGIWSTSLIICKMIYKEAIRWWLFILFSINWTVVVMYCIDIL